MVLVAWQPAGAEFFHWAPSSGLTVNLVILGWVFSCRQPGNRHVCSQPMAPLWPDRVRRFGGYIGVLSSDCWENLCVINSCMKFLFGSGTIAVVYAARWTWALKTFVFSFLSYFPLNSTLPTAISFQAIRGVYFKANWPVAYSVVFKVKTKILQKEMNSIVKEQKWAALVS